MPTTSRILISTIVFSLLLCLVTTAEVAAADAIVVPPQTILQRGESSKIIVSGTIQSGSSARLILTYPANVIRIIGVQGGEAFLFRCTSSIIVANEIISGTTGQLTLECPNVRSGTDEALFEIEVEALFNQAVSGIVRPIELQLDEVQIPDAELVSGSVLLEGESGIKPTDLEGFTGNYPNPFIGQSAFVFTMQKAGRVTLNIRNIQGRIVKSIGEIDATAGENEYILNVQAFELAQGPYVMQMVTDRDSYLYSFVVLK